ncbi:MAG: hypothetical protein AAFY71_26005 [Bacteroidota bacterium]
MKKLGIIFFTLLLSIFWYSSLIGQSFGVLTPAHQQVPGTNIFINPPSGFAPSSNFKGFQDYSKPGTAIMINSLPAPMSQVAKGFTAEMLATRAMTLIQKTVISINGIDQYFVQLEQEANGIVFSKTILLFGDENKTVIINGICPKDSTRLIKEIATSVRTTHVKEDIDSDPRAALDFTLDEKVGNLQFISVLGNGMLFNRDKKMPTESPDRVNFIVDRSYNQEVISDQQAFCKRRLSSYPDPFVMDTNYGLKAVKLDGLSGYELYGTNSNKPEEAFYQLILFPSKGGYYIFLGTFKKGIAQAKQDILKVVATFKRK